ncbi:murein DD-endopeptidase MepM/ murein hydrolase activator NlpD [Streptomyces achromogenes]|uniref:Murein DD-endopeptidase MepM/ murein hydrolase activator NlpD n=1 Tax=Streptomyces achromogenes TaxID=67255 RepID=A0ABU0Q561_STRAH|nr:M23 family metallopeptidase [Streptomyces achromogenes]MDQ0685791.1 murein DD-endopeptidase MepM/ murein hydrolase activator NlpD [Streptomyces achromogenes]
MTSPAPASDAASAHYASYGTQDASYDGFTTYDGHDEAGGHDTGAHATGHFTTVDPLFGELPGDGAGAATGTYDGTQWHTGVHGSADTGSHQTLNYDAYAAPHHAVHDSGAYDATAWQTGQHQHLSAVPQQATAHDSSGHWDASAWLQPDQPGCPADATQQWEWGTQNFDTGAYDATQWNSDGDASGVPAQAAGGPSRASDAGGEFEQPAEVPFDQQATATFEQVAYDESGPEVSGPEGESADGAPLPLLDGQEEPVPAPLGRAATRNANRSRRRMPAKRSALLTVAVPSVCVMGVAGIAAASVGTLTGGDGKETTASAADAQPVKPSAANTKLDSQLATLSAGADDFGDRVSRTQERIDLKAQQEAEKKKAAAEAARKERLRPKYALPVAQHGLSAYFGQAGINWMSQHTGIDFPVSYGTTVMAATDGTVRTQWNSAYGNMLILTAKDGTETWYCHLSTYRVPSGTTVKAGDPIAYSGNSGNSTGPHLHFEVRPAGGSAIDPLPWLRSHGLNPT